MNETRRILVLTLSFGSGHVQAARTIAREVERQASEAEIRVVDALAECRLFFRAVYVWPYWAMVRYAPELWERFFKRRAIKMLAHTAPEWVFRWGCPLVFKTIAEFRPDTIVAAEVGASEMAVLAKRQGLTNASVINVITDYLPEPAWVQPEVDIYAVVNAEVRDQLSAWGAPAPSIVKCGTPTDPQFRMHHDATATRKLYGLNDVAPIVLLMGGGMGPTRMDEVAALLGESRKRMQIVAVTGQDKHVRRRLARLRVRPHVSLKVLGWTDDVAALMQAATVLVTKPGGLTISEATIIAVPLVVFDPIPGPEQRNAARLVEAGAGLLTNGAQETARTVLSLLSNESARRKMSVSAARLGQPNAAAEIAHLVLYGRASSAGVRRRMTA